MKSHIKEIAILVAALSISLTCNAETKPSNFKFVVIEHAIGSKEILIGNYEKGLHKLENARINKRTAFDIATGMCAAKFMNNDLELANVFCTKAIDEYKNRSRSNYQYLTSIAYSNRGIVRFKLGDIMGASNDLETATTLDKNEITLANLSYLKSELSSEKT
ncbi:MAG: tetratricopeptide (TPR) repeat protein [Polaribacter sp.]|jgi:tetratricopeptide (TPR) repeat protein